MIHPERTIAPEIQSIASIKWEQPELITLQNSIPAYALHGGSQEVVRVEFIFNAGSAFHHNPLIPSFTNSMLQEGTLKRSSAEIASAIDDYGAFLELDHDKDYASIVLYTLNRFLPQTLPVIKELITESCFPSENWEILRNNRLQKFKVNQGKVSFLAAKKFHELIFNNTPYGYGFEETSYLNITQNDLHKFWEDHYNMANAVVLISGFVDEHVKNNIDSIVGNTVHLNHEFYKEINNLQASKPIEREQIIFKDDAIQSAIRIGRRLFNRNHPDYGRMKVVSTILGGYFGSRLMKNIREDKGFTYGIGAGIGAYREDGYFYISTEVGVDVTQAALNEIYHEIEVLQNELVQEDELSLVKNYMLGNLLKSFDGPFERMDRFKSLLLYRQNTSFYDAYTQIIKSISSEDIQRLAQTWLQKDDLIELVVGKK